MNRGIDVNPSTMIILNNWNKDNDYDTKKLIEI